MTINITTNRDVLTARLMEHFACMDPTDLLDLWNENNEDDRIHDIDTLSDFYEGACQSDMKRFMYAVYGGDNIDTWPDANYFAVNAYGYLTFLRDYNGTNSPFDAEDLAGKLIDDGDSLADDMRDALIAEAHADPGTWDDDAEASPAAYLIGLNAMFIICDNLDELHAMAHAFMAWKATHPLKPGEMDSFKAFFRDLAARFGLIDEFTAIGVM